ncbi:MAG TPA: PEP-CTERM sorting domain-containing protein [Acetobacteraceae bacterium]|nr:PEP-CTERM sorting domain-containing protein [Acetobacteraceae bacterium]
MRATTVRHEPGQAHTSHPMRPAMRVKRPIGTAIGLLLCTQAHAGLLGDTLTASYRYPDLAETYNQAIWTPPSFVVGPGAETTASIEDVTQIHVDFTDATLVVTLHTVLSAPAWNASTFSGPVFVTDRPLGIHAIRIDPATTMSGFDASRVWLTDAGIAINWAGLSYIDGTSVSIDFNFNAPEPPSLGLVGIGLAALAMIRRYALQRRNAP